MSYSVGDRVIVRADLNQDTGYWMHDESDYWYATANMLANAGKVVTISECREGCCYFVEGGNDKEDWYTDEMFSGLYDPFEAMLAELSIDDNSPLNDYSRACWYCQPGGIVDRLAFAGNLILLCPHCGRVCDGRGR